MEPLGIKIETARGGGIFVSSVSEKSLAAQAGLEVGDQLLEVSYIVMSREFFCTVKICSRFDCCELCITTNDVKGH